MNVARTAASMMGDGNMIWGMGIIRGGEGRNGVRRWGGGMGGLYALEG